MTAETSNRNGGLSEAAGAELDAKVPCSDLTNTAGDSDGIMRCKEDSGKEDANDSYVIGDEEQDESADIVATDPEEDREKKRFVEEEDAVEVDALCLAGENGSDGECGRENGHDLGKAVAEERELEEGEGKKECCMDNERAVDGSVGFFEQQQRTQESQEEKGGSGECSGDDVQSVKIGAECVGCWRDEQQESKGEDAEKVEGWNADGHGADHVFGVRDEQESDEKKGRCSSEGCDVDDKMVECQEVLKMDCDEKLVIEVVESKEENDGRHGESIGEFHGLKQGNGECLEELISEMKELKDVNGSEEVNGECHEELISEMQELKDVNGSQEVIGECLEELISEMQELNDVNGSEEVNGECLEELISEMQELKDVNGSQEVIGECLEELISEMQELNDVNGSEEVNGECLEELISEMQELKDVNGSDEVNGECLEELISEMQELKDVNGSEEVNGELQGAKEVNGAKERWEVIEVGSHVLQESRDLSEFCKDHDVDTGMESQQELKAELEAECHEKSRVACIKSKGPQDLEKNIDSAEFCNENGYHECKLDLEVVLESERYDKSRDGSEEVNKEDSRSCKQGSFHAGHSAEFLEGSKVESKETVEESRDTVKLKEIEEDSRDSGDSQREADRTKECCEEDRELANEIQEICELKVEKEENNDTKVIAEQKDDEIASDQKNLESDMDVESTEQKDDEFMPNQKNLEAIDVEDDRESSTVTIEIFKVSDDRNMVRNQAEVSDEETEVKNKAEASDEAHEVKKQAEASDEVHEVKNQVEASDEEHEVRSQVAVTDELHEVKSQVEVTEELCEFKNRVEVTDELHEVKNQVEELHEVKSQVEVAKELHVLKSQFEVVEEVCDLKNQVEVRDEVLELMNQNEVSVVVRELKNQVEVSDEVHELGKQVVTEQFTMDDDGRDIEVKDQSFESSEEVQECKPVDPSPSSQEDSSQEGSTAAVSDSAKVDAEVGKRMPCFLIRMPRYVNNKSSLEIDLAAKEVDKRTQHRDSFRDAIKLKRDACNECRDILESARSEEKAARGALSAKRQEINTLQATINRMKDATSIDEIEEKIHSMEHKIEHETMSLKEEKQLIREIKQLRKDREELCAKTGAQSELQDTFDQKDDIEKRFKSLKQELDNHRQEVSRAENVTKLAKQKYDAECKILFELKEKFKDADVLRQEAYEHLVNLRKQSYEKNKYFRMYNEDKKTAWNYASTGNRDALQCHCSNQVEKIMELWNKDDEFRNDYVKNNMRSTLRRLNTLDGRSLGPDEKPLVLDSAEERTGNAIAATSVVEQENLGMTVVAAEVELKPTADAGQRTSLFKSKKLNKIDVAESAQTAVSGRLDREELEKERIRAKEEEEMAKKAEEEERKEQELARREEESRKEEAAVKLKEQRRLEEKVKAKEAEERKRRNSEKAQARAESRAKREAELKEKEREKRMRKKEKKKAAAAASDGTGGSTEGESAAVANPSIPEATRELESKEKPTTMAKRPVKLLPAAKQQTPRPLPMPLRNRGKRRMQPWMWAVAIALLVFTLFFVANFFELSVPSFGF